MSDAKFLRRIDALIRSRDWEEQSAAQINRDIQAIVIRAMDIYLTGKGPRPPIPKKVLDSVMTGKGPRPPIPLPGPPSLLFGLYAFAALHTPLRERRRKRRR